MRVHAAACCRLWRGMCLRQPAVQHHTTGALSPLLSVLMRPAQSAGVTSIHPRLPWGTCRHDVTCLEARCMWQGWWERVRSGGQEQEHRHALGRQRPSHGSSDCGSCCGPVPALRQSAALHPHCCLCDRLHGGPHRPGHPHRLLRARCAASSGCRGNSLLDAAAPLLPWCSCADAVQMPAG